MKINCSLVSLATVVLLLGSYKIVYSQNFEDELKNDFGLHKKNRLQLYLFLNQPAYAPGDTIFYMSYWRSLDELKTSPERIILHLDLIDSMGQSKLHSNFLIKQNERHNQIVLPVDFSPGLYLMQISCCHNNNNSIILSSSEIRVVDQKLIKKRKSPAVLFFAEGGSLVAKVSSKLILNSQFNNQNFQIISSNNGVVADSKFDSLGNGVVTFTPENQMKYVTKVEGEERIFELPIVSADGIGLSVSRDTEHVLRVNISLPSDSKWIGKSLFLAHVNENRLIRYSAFLGDNVLLEIKFSDNKLLEGLNCISIVDSQRRQLASRYFYVEGKDRPILEIKSSSQKLFPRDTVQLDFTLREPTGKPLEGQFSISITPKKLFAEDRRPKITGVWGFSDIANSPHSSLDHFLISKQNDFPWEDVLSSSNKMKSANSNQNQFIVLRGKAFFADSKKPVPDSTRIMVYLQQQLIEYEGYTRNGEIEIPFLFDFFNEDRLFYAMELNNKPLENAILEMERHPPIGVKAPTTQENEVDPYGTFNAEKKMIANSYSFYSIIKNLVPRKRKTVNFDFEEEMGGADVTINVDDYLTFTTMIELIKVMPVYQKKINGKYFIQMRLSNDKLATQPPLFFINGAMTKNSNSFMDLSPGKISYIKMIKDVNKLSQLGSLGKHGLIIVLTKNEHELLDQDSTTVINVLGLSKKIEVKQPISSNTMIPDFRSCIYWAPTTVIENGKASVSFTTSDDVGPMVVRVEGVTNDGRGFSQSTELQIVFKGSRLK